MKLKFNPKELLYLSNLLSILRLLLLIPFILFIQKPELLYFLLAVGILFLAILTDIFDGYAARKLNQVTELGKLMDPLSDKIVTAIGGFCLVLFCRLPSWIFLVMMSRDVLIFIGGLYLIKKTQAITMANIFGKINTQLHSLMALILILGKLFSLNDVHVSQYLIDKWEYVRTSILYVVVISNIFSFLAYIKVFFDKIKENKVP
jgi:cardiolipin synthase (CMP-forming)